MVGRIGVEPAFDGARRHLECPTTCRRLDGLEVDAVDCSGTNQRFDLGDDFRLERRFEPPF